MSPEVILPIPAGYPRLIPYLTVSAGDRFLAFLSEVFGAELNERVVDEHGGLRHAEVRIAGTVLMVSEAAPEWPVRPASFYLYDEDCDALYRKALAAGASSMMEPADQYYGDRNAGVKDPVGNTWWFATRFENVPSDELARRHAEKRANP